jgi:tight adherence protein B
MPIISLILLGAGVVVLFGGALLIARLANQSAAPGGAIPRETGLGVYLQQAALERQGVVAGMRQLVDVTVGQVFSTRRSKQARGLEQALLQANLRMRPAEWLLCVAGGSILLGGLLALRFGSLLAFPVGLILGWFGFRLGLRFQQKRRIRKFNAQLLDALFNLSSAMRAGFSINQALETVAKGVPAPCGPEFERVIKEISFGVPHDVALAHLVERNESPDLELLSLVIQVQRETGGSLAEAVQKIAETVRDKIKIKAEVRTLSTQARVSGYVLALIPVGLFGFFLLAEPSYFAPLLNATIGKILLVLGVVSEIVGALIIRKIADIEY